LAVSKSKGQEQKLDLLVKDLRASIQ